MSEAASKTPSSPVNEGQTVKFIPRDANSEARVVPYYDFYTSLTGTVAKLYDDGTAAVIIDRSSLPTGARERHEKSETDMRDRWLRSLSEDDRNKLSEIQRQFNLRYTLLVTAKDLIDIGATPPAVPEKPTAKKLVDNTATSPRPTEDKLAAAEAAHFEEVKKASGAQ